MSKKDTSYADAMNEWAAKQSFLRNKRNRILHPDPGHRPFVRFLGYALRLLIVLFLLLLAASRRAVRKASASRRCARWRARWNASWALRFHDRSRQAKPSM